MKILTICIISILAIALICMIIGIFKGFISGAKQDEIIEQELNKKKS